MSAVPTPLTPKQVEITLQKLTMQWLGITLGSNLNDPAYSKVRVGWQQEGQPAWTIEDDVVILRAAVESDEAYNRVRDIKAEDVDNDNVNIVTTYTRTWRIIWAFYGPNSFDRARILRSNLFSQIGHDILVASNLYLVTDVADPQRVPEKFSGRWWERVDFEVKFNEGVVETEQVGTVLSSEVIVENAEGVVADLNVTAP